MVARCDRRPGRCGNSGGLERKGFIATLVAVVVHEAKAIDVVLVVLG